MISNFFQEVDYALARQEYSFTSVSDAITPQLIWGPPFPCFSLGFEGGVFFLMASSKDGAISCFCFSEGEFVA